MIANAGSELQAYVSQVNTGGLIYVAGSLLVGVGVGISSPIISGVGVIVALVGEIIQGTAINHINEAGVDLRAAAGYPAAP